MIRFYILLSVIFALTMCGSEEQSLQQSLRPVDKDKELVLKMSAALMPQRLFKLVDFSRQLNTAARQACEEGHAPVAVAQLQELWRGAMTSFHHLDVMAYGPMAENAGTSVRGASWDQLYSWPVTNDLAVETQLEKAHKSPDNYRFRNDKFGQIGLDALEYILFSRLTNETAVDHQSQVCPYLYLLTEDIATTVHRLEVSFHERETDLLGKKSTVGEYREVIARMVQALQFFEDMVLERKLAAPLGKSKSKPCQLNVDCHTYLEHPFANSARLALIANVESWQELFTGGEGFGFADYLVAIGETAAAVRMTAEIDILLAELRQAPDGEAFLGAVKSFKPAQCEFGSLCSIYQRTKFMADWIKSDFIVLMSKDAPLPVQGDND